MLYVCQCWIKKPRNGSPLQVPTTSSTQPPSLGIKLVYKPSDVTVDAVFIHVLTRYRERTLTAEGAAASWPKLFLPEDLPNARILTFGCNTRVVDVAMVSNNRIGDHAKSLISALANYRENDSTNDRPIFFVAHSLRGLVCKDTLLKSRGSPEKHHQRIPKCVSGIALFGMPHFGSDISEWGQNLAKVRRVFKQTNPRIVEINQSRLRSAIQNIRWTSIT